MDKPLLNADPPSRNIMDHNADDGGDGGCGDYDDDYTHHRKSSKQRAVKCISQITQI